MKTLLTSIVLISTQVGLLKINAQFVCNKYDEVIAYSYIDPKIEKLKKNDRIRTLQLPSYNNDSLFWENNIQYLLPKRHKGPRTLAIIRAAGFNIDTTINFFDAATRIKINQGYVWLYRITSPTAMELGVKIRDFSVDSACYISAHSNFTDSISGPYEYRLPEVEPGPKTWKKEDNNGYEFGFTLLGNILYVEYFSPFKRDLPSVVISGVTYFYIAYNSVYRLSDAPRWIRDRYLDVDFENGCYY